jgi:hypothetical protein
MRARLLVLIALAVAPVLAQVPQPFPKPGQQPPAAPTTQAPQPATPVASLPAQSQSEPPAGSLGVPVYPSAQFIASYDAGKGQRYYLYGTTASFAEMVQYYRNALKQRGDLVFEEPPIHQFEIGRFREETMAFPPSVTVKDYTWGGSAGYLVPKADGKPLRFPTIIQIVPNPPVVAR